MSTTLTAPTTWAQRKPALYLTITIPSAKNVVVKVTSEKKESNPVLEVTFNGAEELKDKNHYLIRLPLFDKINQQKSSYKLSGRAIEIRLKKRSSNSNFWQQVCVKKKKKIH